jgi:hypothetical protein
MPPGTGYMQETVGYVSNFTCNNITGSATQGYYYDNVFDVLTLNISTYYPRIYKRTYYNPCSASASSAIYTIPLYTAIISAVNGVPNAITFDDGCYFCGYNNAGGPGAPCSYSGFTTNGSLPIDDVAIVNCASDQTVCYPSASFSNNSNTNSSYATVSSCDLKLYVVWTGTDRNGKYFTSAGMRFSSFRQFGVATAYQGAIDLGNAAVNLAKNAIGLTDGFPGRIFN